MLLRGAHASLRYDADPHALAAYLEELVYRHRLQVLTTTESRSRMLVRALRVRLGPNYRVVRRHEYLHVWDRRALRGRSHWAHLLAASPIRYWMMGKLGRRFLVGTQRLRHRGTGRLCRFSTGHAPSGIEGRAGRWRVGALLGRIASARNGFDRWGRTARRWQRGRRVQVLSLDANLDQRLAPWRVYLDRELGGRSVWHEDRPELGTHGRRVIDDVRVLGARVTRSRVDSSPRPPGVDHRAVVWAIDL